LGSHILLENVVQLCVILFCIALLRPAAVILAATFQLNLFAMIWYWKGKDPHHRTYSALTRCGGGPFVTAEYHALHHYHFNNYYSSYIKIIDYILGTGHHLTGKHIAMTGASGALGSQMKKFLEREKAIVTCFKYGKDYDYTHYDHLIPALKTTDILFLCHGNKFENAQEANCDSYIKIIELYKKVHEPGVLPPEIWATGSEIECHPCFGIPKIKIYATSKRNYARYARQCYHDKSIQYRHLVHSSFISKMGPGLMTAKFAAFASMFFIKRGLRYIPVSYTGVAFINYFRFLFSI